MKEVFSSKIPKDGIGPFPLCHENFRCHLPMPPACLPPGCHYAPNEPSPAPFPFPFVRHQDYLNKELRVFRVENPEITKHETPVGLTHIGKPGRVKANWFLSAETFNGAPDNDIYFKMFARHGSNRIRISARRSMLTNRALSLGLLTARVKVGVW